MLIRSETVDEMGRLRRCRQPDGYCPNLLHFAVAMTPVQRKSISMRSVAAGRQRNRQRPRSPRSPLSSGQLGSAL